MTTINGDPNGRGEAILQTTGGGYAIAGTGTGPVPRLLTLDADGKVLSDTSFGEPPDYGSSIAEANDGGYVVSSSAGQLFRVNESNSVIWSTPLGSDQDGWTVVGMPDGGYAAAGGTRVVRVGDDGTIEWETLFEPGRDESTIIALPSGSMVSGGNFDAGVWVTMLDGEGGVVWDRTFTAGPSAELSIIRLSPSQTYDLVYGTTEYTGVEPAGVWITKTTEVSVTADGRVVGEKPMKASRVIVGTIDGGYAYAGYAVPGFTELQPTGYPESPLHLVRLDKAGTVTGDFTYTMRNDGSIVSIIQTVDGGFAILGNAYVF
jgi:hypothetical protein